MNNYMKLYHEKKVSPCDIYRYIENNDTIIGSLGALEPMTFYENLHTVADRISYLSVNNTLNVGQHEFMLNPKYSDTFHLWSWFLLGPGRAAQKLGNMDYIPGHLHNAGTRYAQDHAPDVFVCTVAPMDKHGYFRYSLSNVYESIFLKNAKKILLEVNLNVPFAYGENVIHISEITALYESDKPLPTLPEAPISENDQLIGKNVATLVEDGDTIQLGIGSIPDAVAQAFYDKKDLGLHTELITNSVVDLYERGVLTGKKKTLYPEKMIGTFALGSKRLYDFIDRNPSVLILPGCHVNDPNIIAKNDNMVSINTALAVDFGGQVSSESIGPIQHSGSGGQNDTAEGAVHAKNGRAIIALSSTAKNGSISTIQPSLPMGSIVTLSRNNLDYVVTEFGVACIKNQTIKQRTRNLIEIAHPKFREELLYQAKKYNFL